MSRADLIKQICSLALDTENYTKQQNQSATKLLEEVTRGRISEEVAHQRYQSILDEASSYWSGKYKSKVVYESLQRYQKGELDNVGIAKMVSSLITHSLIEKELNESATLEQMGTLELMQVLENMLSSGLNESCSDMLDSILHRYGYLNYKKEGD